MALVCAGCAIESVAAVKSVEPYYEDDVVTISPPASARGLMPFVIPAFRGLLRVGAPNEYGTRRRRNDPEVYANMPQRMQGVANKQRGEAVYLALLAYGAHRDEITVPTLREAMIAGSNPANAQFVNHDRDWPVHTHYLGISLTNDAEFRRFFCTEGAPCSLDTIPNPRAPLHPGMQVPFWGGGKNEFRGREGYRSFVDTHAAELFRWGASLNRDIYMVSLIDYNSVQYSFDRGGYAISFGPARVLSAEQPRTEIHTATHSVKFPTAPGRGNIELFVPMSVEAGRAFFERYQERARASKPLYAVYAARITTVSRAKGQNYPAMPLNVDFEHVITGDAIEFFYGDDLKEPALEVALR